MWEKKKKWHFDRHQKQKKVATFDREISRKYPPPGCPHPLVFNFLENKTPSVVQNPCMRLSVFVFYILSCTPLADWGRSEGQSRVWTVSMLVVSNPVAAQKQKPSLFFFLALEIFRPGHTEGIQYRKYIRKKKRKKKIEGV